MTIAFVYSGQGAQYLGMGKEFFESSDNFKKNLEFANEQVSFDLLSVLFEDEGRLNQTEFTQPAILAVSVAISELIKEMCHIRPTAVAGLSLGEYTALVESQALSFEEALKLVQIRGRLMSQTVPDGVGAMAAVMGLDRQIVENVCQKCSGNELVVPANYNMPGQIVIAGHKNAVLRASEELLNEGAKKVIPLNVSGPFHTSLLKEASDELSLVLADINFKALQIPTYTNVNGHQIKDVSEIRDLLTKQVMSPVYWEDLVLQMIKDGVDTFIEVGPGRALSSFIKKIDRSVTVYNVENLKTLSKLQEKLGENNVKK
ncbi:ACP S-malonyltransferase [Vagococcus silagei]|uniref:Malonyl CoA-acyl carrier protein transacylase n=1 Tax=Vagococcus silagei TaxID=2508885 RepID=A0A4S3B6R3_9ENTE|nr:ACP S-malonyltransferase [Vagococcus silagei]THB61266.1 [acyl-carrier-protein] S-malonyltransferase [Vagococcus silagei]